MPSNKSTKDDIEKKAKEALEAKENEDDETPEGEETETPEGEEETPTGNEADETPEGEEGDEGEDEGEEGEGEGEEDQGKKKTPATPPVEERYKNQQRENQVLFAKQKKFTETVEQAAQLAEPTEQELQAEYPEWDTMTDTEKRLAKDNLQNKRKFDMVHQGTLEGKKIDEWNEKVDQFLVSGVTKFPRLAGKEDEFRNFCTKPTRRGLDFEDLVKAFLFDVAETPTPRKKGSLLETGSGGRGGEKKQGEFMDERQAATLRTKNHKLYNKLVKAGKIKIQL